MGGKVTRVTKVIKVTKLANPRGTSLTQTTNNREVSPSRKRLFVLKILVNVVVYMAVIHMSVLSYPKCTKFGKLKKILEVNNHLRILRHLN